MIWLAFATTAPWTTLSPTPPVANTATVEPGSTLAVLSTAPTPVMTAQPINAATVVGTSGSIGIAADSCTTLYSANDDMPRPNELISRSPLRCRREPSGNRPGGGIIWLHRFGRPMVHMRQRPQFGANDRMTWSPGFVVRTFAPTFSTIPAASWPRIIGNGKPLPFQLPSITW